MLYTKVESELSPRERLVLKMRYGLYDEEEYTAAGNRRSAWYFSFLCVYVLEKSCK